MLYLKTINDRPADSDGYRLMITNEWPKGKSASFSDGFNPNLAPPRKLYDMLLSGKTSSEKFKAAYSRHLDGFKPRILNLKKQVKDFDITLVSYPDFNGFSIGRVLLEKIEAL